MYLYDEVSNEIVKVARDQKLALAAFDTDSKLFSFGLDSLAFVTLVARIEHKFGINVFDASEENELPMAVGDLVRFYENQRTRQARHAHQTA